jgi:hypothetical protein
MGIQIHLIEEPISFADKQNMQMKIKLIQLLTK